jgi:isoleucyl-tRNA synthetase
MEGFDTHEAGKLLAAFVDDLSNWYVRRSRRRFWRGDPAALATLHETLRTLTLLLAPLMPFVTEKVWQDMIVAVDPAAAESVHLASYPVADDALIDVSLGAQMALARRLVELGRAARAESGVKTRQPLSSALASAQGLDRLGAELIAEIASELNVGTVLPMEQSLVDASAKANFRALGKRFGKRVQEVAAAIAASDGRAVVDVAGEPIELAPDEVFVTETPREGWAVASEPGATVALDLRLTPELRRAGLARDAIRLIQEARKATGLDVSDRIELRYSASRDDMAEALSEHRDLIADEVLATTYGPGEPTWDGKPHEDPELGLTFWLRTA